MRLLSWTSGKAGNFWALYRFVLAESFKCSVIESLLFLNCLCWVWAWPGTLIDSKCLCAGVSSPVMLLPCYYESTFLCGWYCWSLNVFTSYHFLRLCMLLTNGFSSRAGCASYLCPNVISPFSYLWFVFSLTAAFASWVRLMWALSPMNPLLSRMGSPEYTRPLPKLAVLSFWPWTWVQRFLAKVFPCPWAPEKFWISSLR